MGGIRVGKPNQLIEQFPGAPRYPVNRVAARGRKCGLRGS